MKVSNQTNIQDTNTLTGGSCDPCFRIDANFEANFVSGDQGLDCKQYLARYQQVVSELHAH